MENEPGTRWDCVVVGGGAAGLSAALVLGRARRRTLVVDAGGQSNLAAHGIGGLLGNDRRPPADFYAEGHRELAAYPSVEVRAGRVVEGERTGEGGFALRLEDGSRETARRVLLATGMDYRYPQLLGAEERWGNSVFHCPFCHGWEVHGRPLAVYGSGAGAVHRALLLRAWSDDVVVLSDGPAELEDDAARRLTAAGIAVDERPLAELRGEGRDLSSVAFADGTERPLGGLLVPVTLHQRGALAGQLGATVAEAGPLSEETVRVDPRFATTAPGLYAAGDLTSQMPSVASSVMAGSVAAAALVGDLTGAVPAGPAPDAR